MRIVWTIAGFCCLVAGLPAAAQTTTDQRQASEETAPPAPAGESTPADLLPRQGSVDISALTSLLGQLLNQGPPPPLPAPPHRQATQVDSRTPAPGQTDSAATSGAGTGVASGGTPGYAVPSNSGFMPHHHGPLSRDAFHQRIYARRMALVNRIRAAAEGSGNAQMAAQANQLEVLVTKVHQEGLGGIVQMLGQLQAARQSENTAPSTPPAVVPEEDLGEAAPLTGDAAPPASAAPDTDPPRPQPDGEPELPPPLPVPGDPPR